MCLLLALKSKMDNFLRSYSAILKTKGINTFTFEDKKTALSSVVLLLRRHSINNRLCCNNNENQLQVTGIDRYGFVTQVICTNRCHRLVETACYDAKWSYERIYDERRLEPGDHICWHRPVGIWHHAIVTAVEPLKVIHYSDLKVKETAMPGVCSDSWSRCNAACSGDACCRGCNALYRINYEDCYDANYSILRAQKLLDESRYDLLEQNCEHFSRWCKTGSTKSTQVGIIWASLAKTAVAMGLRVFALILLGLLQYSHESQENHVKDPDREHLEKEEVELIVIYMILITVAFTIYLLIISGSRLGVDPASLKRQDMESPRSRWRSCTRSWCGDCTKESWWCMRYCCCLLCGCFHLFSRAVRCLLFYRHIQRSPSTCCRRPCNLACGLFWRIFFREILAGAATLSILLNEEWITDTGSTAEKPARERTTILILYSTLAHVVGYTAGIFVGRLAEACCDCCGPSPAKHTLRFHDMPGYYAINNA